MMKPQARLGAAVAAIAILSAAGAGCAPAKPSAPSIDDLAGVWAADLEHNGQTGHFVLELKKTDEGGLEAFASIPDIEVWGTPAGAVSIEGSQVKTGPLLLEYDAGRKVLSGDLKNIVVPIYTMKAELRKVPVLPKPAGTEPSLAEAEPIWTHDTGTPVWAGVAYADGRVFTGGDDGVARALDSRTGRELWRAETGGAVRARPTIDGGSILIHSDDGFLYRLDAATGRQRWRAELGPATERLHYGDETFRYDSYASAPTVVDGAIFVGHDDGSVHALDAGTGESRWRIRVGDAVTSTPAVTGGRVFFGSFDGKVRAVEAATGEPVWEHDTGLAVPSSPALHDGLVIVGSRSFDLLALDASSGAPAWKYYFWFSWVESSATMKDGIAYIGSSDAQLVHAIDAADGHLIWKFDTGGSAWGQPAVSDGAVFLGGVGVAGYSVAHEGGFFAIDRHTGQGLWRFASPRPEDASIWGFASSPAVGEDMVFAAGLDGRVHAFRQQR